jgi:hypothetical protein
MLFDLERNPSESVNRAGDPQYAQARKHLSGMLAQRLAKPALAEGEALAR